MAVKKKKKSTKKTSSTSKSITTSKSSTSQKALISKDFFGNGIEIDTDKVFPMLVMATMSSGKSTLINALLGEQILPSSNEACTAKMYSILDDDQNMVPQIFITKSNGELDVREEEIADALVEANEDDQVEQIFIKSHVKGVLNTDKALLIIDTPGPNNARNLSHEKVMESVLEKVYGGLVLYVMNATQFGINDDKILLQVLKKHIKNQPNTRVLFVINKVDQIDVERESIDQLILTAYDYLNNNGFSNPEIIPVSALGASLFKKVLNGETLTRSEYRAFLQFYDLYKPLDFNMKSYAITEDYDNQFSEVSIKDVKYKLRDIIRAIENTGIMLLEDNIQKAQILSSGQLKNIIRGEHKGGKV